MNKTFTLKRVILPAVFLALAAGTASAQYCVPNTLGAYNANMPGVTNFTLGSINRTSGDLESSSNNYVNTGLSTSLTIGATNSVSITHTIDPQICPDMNLRVWIDYNHDGTFDDPGETVISVNNHLPGTYTGSFIVPATAMTGTTGMRITAKMSSNGGHSLPTPCDIPADPLGYHGEMEDYTVDIQPLGVNDQPVFTAVPRLNAHPSAETHLQFGLAEQGQVTISLVSMTGQLAAEISKAELSAGSHEMIIRSSDYALPAGIYLLRIESDKTAYHLPYLVMAE